jgi:peptidoglycan/xylan/chitin deacetylase (PgdA/CDA1 family)
MRYFIGNIIGYFLVQTQRFFARKRYKNHILSIYFHNPQKYVFENCINYLKANNYKFLSADQLYSILCSRKLTDEKYVFISLDDTWRDNLQNVIPCSEYNRIPITIFTPIQPLLDGVLWLRWFRDKKLVEQLYNDYPVLRQCKPKELTTTIRNEIWEKLRSMKSYPREIMTENEVVEISESRFVSIEAHTVSHPILTKCNSKELDYELKESKRYLKSLLKMPVQYMAYPNGDYNKDTIDVCRLNHYKMAFTTVQRMINIQLDQFYELPRYCVPNGYGKYESLARMLGLWNKIIHK